MQERLKSKGVELEAEQRFEKWLRLFANFTYNNGKITENVAKPQSVGKNYYIFRRKCLMWERILKKVPSHLL